MKGYPLSDHYDGRTFRNPQNHVDRSWADVMRWKLKARPEPWPDTVPVTPVAPARGPLAVSGTLFRGAAHSASSVGVSDSSAFAWPRSSSPLPDSG